MPSAEVEILKIQYQFEGDTAIQRARDAIARLESAQRVAKMAMDAGVLSAGHYGKAMDDLARKLATAKMKLDAFQATAKGGGGSTRNLGMSALVAGQALQDLNYGLSAVMNNLPQLVSYMGGPAGLAGAIAVVGAAYIFLQPQIDKFLESMKPAEVSKFKSEIEALKAELEKIESKPIKVVLDYQKAEQVRDEIEARERAIAAGRQVVEAQSPEQESYSKGVDEALAGRGGEVQRVIQDQLAKELVATDTELQSRRRRAEETRAAAERLETMAAAPGGARISGSGALAAAREAARKAEQDVRDREGVLVTSEARDKARELIGEAKQGEAGTEALIRRLEGKVDGGLIANLQSARQGFTQSDIQDFIAEDEKESRQRLETRRRAEEQHSKDLDDYIAEDERENEKRLKERAQAEDRTAKEYFAGPAGKIAAAQLEEGITADSIRSSLTTGLAPEVGQADAERFAKEFVDGLVRDAETKDVAEILATDPAKVAEESRSLGRDQAAFERSLMEDLYGKAPQMIGAESFAAQVQSSQRTPIEEAERRERLMEDANKLGEQRLKELQSINKAIQRQRMLVT